MLRLVCLCRIIHCINAKAYSYIRFSTPEQARGDSYRRQTKLAEDYCKRHGLELQPLQYKDLGVSGFKGDNLKSGALSQFIACVRDGSIPSGSWLLIENWDRFSRLEPEDAMREFLNLIDLGVVVVTLDPETVHKKGAVDFYKLMGALMSMARANDESARKSERIRTSKRKAMEEAREGKRIITKRCPNWMEYKDGGFTLIPERSAVVKVMFRLYISGLGLNALSQHLNREGIKPFGKSKLWTMNTVSAILKRKATYGVMAVSDGEDIQGYYPAVIDEDTYLAAQSIRDKRVTSKDRVTYNGEVKHLFAGILHCSCGSHMTRVHTGSSGGLYYRCYADLVKACDKGHRSLKLEQTTALLLHTTVHAGLHSYLEPKQEDSSSSDEAINAIQIDLEATQSRIETALDELLDFPSEALRMRLRDLEQHKAKLLEDMQKLKAKDAAKKELSAMSSGDKALLQKLADLYISDDQADRTELSLWLKRTYKQITYHDTWFNVELNNGRTFVVEYRSDYDSWYFEGNGVHVSSSIWSRKRKKNSTPAKIDLIKKDEAS